MCHNATVNVGGPRFRLIEGGLGSDRPQLDLPQESLDLIERMLREIVPKFARYGWFIDAEGWAFVFEGEPPSDRTYLMRCLAHSLCRAGEPVDELRIHPTPNLAPFEVRLHVQTVGPGRPQAVLICQPQDHADLVRMEQALAGIRPRLESLVAGATPKG